MKFLVPMVLENHQFFPRIFWFWFISKRNTTFFHSSLQANPNKRRQIEIRIFNLFLSNTVPVSSKEDSLEFNCCLDF